MSTESLMLYPAMEISHKRGSARCSTSDGICTALPRVGNIDGISMCQCLINDAAKRNSGRKRAAVVSEKNTSRRQFDIEGRPSFCTWIVKSFNEGPPYVLVGWLVSNNVFNPHTVKPQESCDSGYPSAPM